MFFIVKEYLKYVIRAIFSKKENSEFVETFIVNILKKKLNTNKVKQIERLKAFYINNPTTIQKEDYGVGSRKKKNSSSISTKNILKHVTVKEKYGNILNNLSNFYGTKKVLELGTSLGVGSTYLSTNSNKITTIEGNKELFEYVQNTFDNLKIKNIVFIHSKFDAILEYLLKGVHNFDLIFIDGNHSKEATLRYFELILKYNNTNSIVIFDDIYWSFGMKNAWNTIRSNKDVMLSIDLFQFGIIFFNSNLKQKEHYTLWY